VNFFDKKHFNKNHQMSAILFDLVVYFFDYFLYVDDKIGHIWQN